MSKKRALDSKTRSSQTFSKLSYRQRDLWHGLIAVADDQGRLPGVPAYVRSQVWPFEDLPLDEVSKDLARLQELGMIARYEVEGQEYIQLVNWWKYQQMQWAGPSDHPAPDGWIDRHRYHSTGNKVTTLNWDSPGGFVKGTDLPKNKGRNKGTGESKRDVNDEVNVNDEINDEDEVNEKPHAHTPAERREERREMLEYFFSTTGLAKFKKNTDAETFADLLDTYGKHKLRDCIDWIATKENMTTEKAISSMKTALPNWSSAGSKNGRAQNKGIQSAEEILAILEANESDGND